jgi:hypothetical protein
MNGWLAIFFAGTIIAHAGDSTNAPNTREPAGSTTHFTKTTNSDNQIVFHFHNDTSGSNWVVYGGPVPISLPYKYKDPDSEITFEVESDGRHIVAVDADGKTLWRRDPFADARLKPYRTATPKIVYISNLRKDDAPHQWIRKAMEKEGVTNFICINFNSSQSGCLDIRNGNFTFLGQD